MCCWVSRPSTVVFKSSQSVFLSLKPTFHCRHRRGRKKHSDVYCSLTSIELIWKNLSTQFISPIVLVDLGDTDVAWFIVYFFCLSKKSNT